MRYYFHLVGPNDGILDEIGIEASSLESARAEALLAIQEIRAEHEDASESLNGWQLEVTDALQKVLITIDLNGLPLLDYVTERRSVVGSGRYVLHSFLATLAVGITWDNLIPII